MKMTRKKEYSVSELRILPGIEYTQEREGEGTTKIFEEKMAKIFPNLRKTFIAVQTTGPRCQQMISTRNMKTTTLRHIIIKLLKNSDKRKILKAARERTLCLMNKDHNGGGLFNRNNLS